MIRAKMMCLSAILFTFFGTNASATEKTHAVAALFKSSETIFQTKSSLLSEASADKGNSFVWQPFGYLSKSLEAILFTFFGTNASATEKTHAVAALFKSSETIFQTKSSLLSEASADKGNSFVWQPF